MRQSLIVFALFAAFLFMSSAAAQGTNDDTTYLLIENSESMWEFRDDAVADVNERVASMTSTDLVSVKIFAGKDIDHCDAPVSIDPPAPPAPDFVLDAPASGGSTIVSNALRELVDNHDIEGASIVIYTDGEYNAPSCESARSICEQVSRIEALSNPPSLIFVLPGLKEVSPKTFLDCDDHPSDEDGDSIVQWERVRFVAAAVFWIAIPLVLFVYLALQNLSMRRYTHDVLELANKIGDPTDDDNQTSQSRSDDILRSASIQDSPKITTEEKTDKEKRRETVLLWVFIASLVVVILIPERFDSLTWLWKHGNDRLPAGIISASIPAMAAWYLVELYRTGDARRHWRWQLSHQTIEQEKIAKEIDAQLSRIFLKRSEYELRLSAKLEKGLDQAEPEERKRISALASKMESVCSLIDEELARTTDVQSLKKLTPSGRAYYNSVCRFLKEDNRISDQDRKSCNSLLVAWEGFLRSLPSFDSETEARILAFETPKLGNKEVASQSN